MNSEPEPTVNEQTPPPDTTPTQPVPETPAVEPAPVEAVEPLQPVQEQPVTEQIPAENEPQPEVVEPASGMVLPPKKSKKKLVIVLAAIVAVLLIVFGGAWAAYALWYNTPDNAVSDAFSKALSAKSGSMTGTLTMNADGSTVKAEISSASNEAKQTSATVVLTIGGSGGEYKLTGNFVGTPDTLYVKLQDLRSTISQALGSEYSAMIDQFYGGLINKIDGKWVVLKSSDLATLTGGSVSSAETQCFENEIAKLQSDSATRDELIATYKNNPLFVVESKGSDSDGNRYSLTPVSDDKAKAFANAVVETKFFKALDDCSKDDLKKSFIDSTNESTSDDTVADATFNVWVDGWTHELKKVAMSAKDDDGELNGEFKPVFNNNPSVTVPTGETTFDDLKSELESIASQLFASTDESTITYDLSEL